MLRTVLWTVDYYSLGSTDTAWSAHVHVTNVTRTRDHCTVDDVRSVVKLIRPCVDWWKFVGECVDTALLLRLDGIIIAVLRGMVTCVACLGNACCVALATCRISPVIVTLLLFGRYCQSSYLDLLLSLVWGPWGLGYLNWVPNHNTQQSLSRLNRSTVTWEFEPGNSYPILQITLYDPLIFPEYVAQFQ